MISLSKLTTLVIFSPGLGGVAYALYGFLKPYPYYVQKIYDLEKQHGGCKFGLVNSKDHKTGGYPGQAVGSVLDKVDETSKKNKLEEVAKNISGDPKVQAACKEKPGKIVELFGSGEGGNSSDTGPGAEHEHFLPS